MLRVFHILLLLIFCPTLSHAECLQVTAKLHDEMDKVLKEKISRVNDYNVVVPIAEKINNTCSYTVFLDLIKNNQFNSEILALVLRVDNDYARDAFHNLISKTGLISWQIETYKCASSIDSPQKQNLFAKMLRKVSVRDFSAETYETLSHIKEEAPLEAFEFLIARESTTNWKSAVLKAVSKIKDSGYKINYPLMAFKKLIEKAKYSDWPDAAYEDISRLDTRKQYVDYLEKYKILTAEERDRVVDQDSLNTLIARYKISSIEQLLPRLPQALRHTYTLMWYSRSQQKADFQRPRAILFSPEGDFVLTFNDADMPGGDTIETISLNRDTFKYDFQRIIFGKGSSKVHPKNESLCKSCHQQELRPNWDNYPYWLGAYGMIEDDMFVYPHIRKRKDVGGDREPTRYTGEATDEDFRAEDQLLRELGANADKIDMLAEFKNFQKLRPKHPRYKYLIVDKDNPYYPFKKETSIFKKNPEPNLRLGELLFAWNVKRVANLYRRHIYEFTARSLRCEFYTPQMAEALANNLRIPSLDVTTLAFQHSHGVGNSGNGDRLAVEYLHELAHEDPEIKNILKEELTERNPGDEKYNDGIVLFFRDLTSKDLMDQVCQILEKRIKAKK